MTVIGQTGGTATFSSLIFFSADAFSKLEDILFKLEMITKDSKPLFLVLMEMLLVPESQSERSRSEILSYLSQMLDVRLSRNPLIAAKERLR